MMTKLSLKKRVYLEPFTFHNGTFMKSCVRYYSVIHKFCHFPSPSSTKALYPHTKIIIQDKKSKEPRGNKQCNDITVGWEIRSEFRTTAKWVEQELDTIQIPWMPCRTIWNPTRYSEMPDGLNISRNWKAQMRRLQSNSLIIWITTRPKSGACKLRWQKK